MLHRETITTGAPSRSILDRRFGFANISSEIVIYALLFFLSIGLHLWQLDLKAMHHDESIHAWMSYKFFTGNGTFPCADPDLLDGVEAPQFTTYCYNPVYHGPTLYVLTLLAYFIFGIGDAQARLPMAVAGIALVPMAWTLRSFIGRKGALIAAVLITLSPSILYYTRFARHDALVLLWSMFMVVGLFKFLRDGGAFNLSLAAAGLSLTWATHELVFILIFIGGSFLALRLLWEWRPNLFNVAMIGVLAVTLVFLALTIGVRQDQSPELYAWTHRLLGPMMMLGAGALLTLPMARLWEREPIVRDRLVYTWRHERRVYWAAAATFLVIFTLLFTTFFAYPRGFLDGWYQGLNYWLLSQHDAARGGQPWFYYFMLLPIYDLLALVFGLIGLGWLMFGGLRLRLRRSASAEADQPAPHNGRSDGGDMPAAKPALPLLVFFLGYWFVQAFVAFSWAGEKMPWLLTHISLPGSLLAAWVLGTMVSSVPWRDLRHDYGWAVPLLTVVLLVSIAVALFAFSGAGETVSGIQSRVRGLLPLIVAGICVFCMLTISGWYGGRVVRRLAALTVAAILLLYGIRATTLVVYRHPDVPVDPLIYTQTSPDVPILVRQIEQVAINQTRNTRSVTDPTGGLSMKIALDGGGSKSGGEGSVAWPMQWYLRDFTAGSLNWIDPDTNPTIGDDVGVVVLAKQHAEQMEAQLDDNFVKTSEGVFNWWFPEYTKDGARGYKSLGLEGTSGAQRVWNVVSWPLRPSNWKTLWDYMLYRKVPMELTGREMVVYMRRDVAPGGGVAAATPTDTLTPESSLATGQLDNARGIALDADGNVYVADANHHRVVVYGPDGAELRSFGSLGHGEGQLNEPSGVSVDSDGNVYVADTWNARIVKFDRTGKFVAQWGDSTTPFGEATIDAQSGQSIQRYATDTDGTAEGNAQNPLGFFGPRNVLVVGDRVYIADTGNCRIVVTDRDGRYIEQIGTLGAAAGQLHEPIGLGVDGQGRLYVGDTWNSRVQIFQIGDGGTIDPNPVAMVNVVGWAPETYNDPYIAVASDGRFWASQGARNTLAEFDAAQRYVRRLRVDPALSAPKGLAIGPDGATLFVSNSGAGEVLRLPLTMR